MRLFVRHERDLRVFARSLLPNWPAVDDVLQEANEAMPDTADVLEKERKTLRVCLEKMGDEQRELVFAASMRDGGVKELAEATNRTANSLYKMIGRLRASLRECVQRELRAQEGTHG